LKESLELAKLNGDTLWADAISQHMKNVSVAFDFSDQNTNTPIGYTIMPNNINGSTYAGVVSRESVCIAFTYAALHDLDIYIADIQNAYLQALLKSIRQ